jgi:hypothetical protein
MGNPVGVNNSSNYEIIESPKFQRSIILFKKDHYGKRNSQGEKEFNKIIEDYIENLKLGIFSDSDIETFPHGIAEDGYEFRKKRWTRLPRLDGASRLGRLIYLIYYPKNLVCLLWFYSHQEFTKQPPDKEFSDLIKCAKQNMLDR